MANIVFAANHEPAVAWIYQRFEAALAERGWELRLATVSTPQEVIDSAAGAQVYLAYRYPVSREVIENLPDLKLLISSGSGFDHIDVEAASERGIMVCNSASYNVEDVAEHTLLLVLAAARKLRLLEAQVREGVWPLAPLAQPRHRFAGRTLGLLGFGKIARALAWRAKGIGLRVIAYDPFVPDDAIIAAGCEPAGKGRVLAESDYVSLHLRLDESTRHSFGADELAQMKPGAYFVNTSRGGLVDEAALADALRRGTIAGAALDVMDPEPPASSNPLLRMDNVIVTGHTAGGTLEGSESLVAEWVAIVDSYLAGGKPLNQVNECL